MEITKDIYEELLNDIKSARLAIQELKDIVMNGITDINIMSNAISTSKIQDDAITTAKITAGAITADLIEAGTITANKIAVGTITADQIEDGTITADKIQTGTITALQISSNTITAEQIAALTITAAEIVAGTITGEKIAAVTIAAGNIVAGTITGAKIAATTITASNIAVGTITADRLASTYIVVTGAAGDVNAGSTTISGGKITTGSITATQIEADTITANKIKIGVQSFTHNLAFTSTDLDTVSWSAGTITMADAATYSIVAGNTGNMAARTYIYLNTATSATVLQTTTTVGDTVGDGKLLIASAINSTNGALFQVNSGIGGVFISGGSIQALSITAAQITAGTITGAKIAALTILAENIAAGAITAVKISVASLAAVSATLGTVSAGTISGTRLNIGADTDEDIYFADSGIRMYDYLIGAGAGYKGITLKYSTENFFHVSFNPTSDHALIHFSPTSTTTASLNTSASTLWLNKFDGTDVLLLYLTPGGATNTFYMYGTGQIQLPNLGANPTANNASGQICMVSGILKYWNGSAWANV